jgi:tripartite-type tricarboxylate transporter receptor subunit TctC
MKELIALSHSSSKKLTFASAGVTSVSQLVWDVVRDGAKIGAIDVPYRGGGPAMADLIAGHVDLTLPSSQVAKPLVDTKRIKCLAVTGKTRSPALPDVRRWRKRASSMPTSICGSGSRYSVRKACRLL